MNLIQHYFLENLWKHCMGGAGGGGRGGGYKFGRPQSVSERVSFKLDGCGKRG